MTFTVIIFSIILATSFTLNLFVVWVLLACRKKMYAKDFLILSLAVCDFLQSLLSVPYLLNDQEAATADGYIPATFQCKMAAFAVTFLAITSISHMTAVSIKYWIAIKYPFWTLEEKKKNIVWFIVPCWFFGLLWAVCPLLGWSSYGKETETGYRCGMNFRAHSAKVLSYNTTLLFAAFGIPIAICVYCYTRISIVYKQLQLKARQQCGVQSRMAYETQKQLRKHYAMNIVILCTFILVWSPYAALAFLNVIGIEASQTLYDCAATLAKSATCYNPIIYAVMYRQFREYVKQTFCKTSRKFSGGCRQVKMKCKILNESVTKSTVNL